MQSFMSRVRAARRGPDQAGFPHRSASGGVEVVIAGWRPGRGDLDSHTLRVLIRDGGVRLGEAVRLVDRVLAGEDVTVRLPFADEATAIQALSKLGACAATPDGPLRRTA